MSGKGPSVRKPLDREVMVRALPEVLVTRLLHERGPLWHQGMLPADPKTNLRGTHRQAKAAALLQEPPHHGGDIGSARRCHLELGCIRSGG
jgi:hypothetical protein